MCQEDVPAIHLVLFWIGRSHICSPLAFQAQKLAQLVLLLAAKPADAQVFETLNATDLNNALKELMDGLSVKVFRTYNASITLDRLLFKESVSQTVEEKKADYDRANKEVLSICRHRTNTDRGWHGLFCTANIASLIPAIEIHPWDFAPTFAAMLCLVESTVFSKRSLLSLILKEFAIWRRFSASKPVACLARVTGVYCRKHQHWLRKF